MKRLIPRLILPSIAVVLLASTSSAFACNCSGGGTTTAGVNGRHNHDLAAQNTHFGLNMQPITDTSTAGDTTKATTPTHQTAKAVKHAKKNAVAANLPASGGLAL